MLGSAKKNLQNIDELNNFCGMNSIWILIGI